MKIKSQILLGITNLFLLCSCKSKVIFNESNINESNIVDYNLISNVMTDDESKIFDSSICEKEAEENNEISNIFLSINTMYETEFVYKKLLIRCVDINNVYYDIYKIFSGSNYSGYLLIDDNLNVPIIYIGEYEPQITNNNCYTDDYSRFISYEEYNLIKEKNMIEKEKIYSEKNKFFINKKKKRINYRLNITREFPCNRSDLKEVSNSPYHYRCQLKGVPEYYNYPVADIINACIPTSAAMLIAYYDMYSNLTDLVDGNMPLNHYDNKDKVNKLINVLASKKYMNTDPKDGTSPYNAQRGLDKYLSDRGYCNYSVCEIMSPDYNDIQHIVDGKNNPVIFNMIYDENTDFGSGIKGSGESIVGHSVLCFGYTRIRYSGDYVITRFNHTSKKGDYLVKLSLLEKCYNLLYVVKLV